MQYPQSKDYIAVLQHPRQAFTVPELQRAVLDEDMGLPFPIEGSSAAVFRATIRQKGYALRCYTRDEASTPERYAALSRFVTSAPTLSTAVGTVKWHERAVRAIGSTWPVLQMEWIDGEVISDYVGYLADHNESRALDSLAGQWLTLVSELQQAEFAHGDLQHRNIIVDGRQRLRLIDFDGVWFPALRGQTPPTERGHDNFQPPGRTSAGRWGARMDTFSALVIYLALKALAKDSSLWAPLNDGENLLFTSKDFSPPFNTKVWDLLARLSDETVDWLAGRLRNSCLPTGAGDKTLETLITPGWWEQQTKTPVPKPATAPRTRPPTGGTGSVPWYTQPMPVPPTGGYQSPVARPAAAPLKRPTTAGGSVKWWETTAQATGAGPAVPWATPPGPAVPWATPAAAGRASAAAVPANKRVPAKKPAYPYRPLAVPLFIIGVILLIALGAHHSDWAWAGVLLAGGGVALYRKK
jgi:hypothetical protein